MNRNGTKFLFFLIVGLAVVSFAGYNLWGSWTKSNGIIARPADNAEFISPRLAELQSIALPPDHQSNKKAVDARMLSMAILSAGMKKSLQEVLAKISAVPDFYKKDGELNWKKLSEAFPEVSYYFKRMFASPALEKELLAGRIAVLKTEPRRGYAWVILAGKRNGDFLVLDPSEAKMELHPLAEYGKVYTYRVVYKAE